MMYHSIACDLQRHPAIHFSYPRANGSSLYRHGMSQLFQIQFGISLRSVWPSSEKHFNGPHLKYNFESLSRSRVLYRERLFGCLCSIIICSCNLLNFFQSVHRCILHTFTLYQLQYVKGETWFPSPTYLIFRSMHWFDCWI